MNSDEKLTAISHKLVNEMMDLFNDSKNESCPINESKKRMELKGFMIAYDIFNDIAKD